MPPIPGAAHILPQDFHTKQDAAIRAFDLFKAAYSDVGAQVKQFSVARAAGYLKIFEQDFIQGFFRFDEDDPFRLDIYVIRACAHFWAAPKPGRVNGHAKRLYYDIEAGLTKLAMELSEQLDEREKLVKPRWMTKQWLETHKPVFTSKQQILDLWILSPIFSTLYWRAPEDPRDAPDLRVDETVNPEMHARADGESTLFVGPMVPLPDWRAAIKNYLEPGEVLAEPTPGGVPPFPFIAGKAGNNITARREEYFEYVKKLGAFATTPLSLTLGQKLKATLPHPQNFNK
ncbi:hypothetical protein SLS58_006527 [Diplodia intermedia]|uniref:Uncharacterized protein n=1 Tax=Diplodia intermedia TaxID=856260 RepID=A0ABR3TMP6_9PEZI